MQASKLLSKKELITLGMIGFMLEQNPEQWHALRNRILDLGYEWQVASFTELYIKEEGNDNDISDTLFEIALDILGDNE